LTLATYNLADSDPDRALTDEVLKHKLRELLALLDRSRSAA
jgi:hypothetical protein